MIIFALSGASSAPKQLPYLLVNRLHARYLPRKCYPPTIGLGCIFKTVIWLSRKWKLVSHLTSLNVIRDLFRARMMVKNRHHSVLPTNLVMTNELLVFLVESRRVDVGDIMQLYHHPYSLDSQKVRLVLEEKNIDYTSFHVNPITGKNFDSSFFRKNPTAKLPVFQNGSHILYDTIEIVQYIERIALVSSGGDESTLSTGEVVEWIYKIQQWNPKYFTLSHVPPKYRLTVSKFLRRVIIARMAECPELASAYHLKLKEEYETEEKLKDPETLRRSTGHLESILDEAESKLSKTSYLLGEEFTLADVVFVPVLSRLALLNLEEEYIATRPNVAEYWNRVQKRPSYRKVIGSFFDGWRRHKALFRTWCFVQIRSLFKQY